MGRINGFDGHLIVFEGIDGSGKSYHQKYVYDVFRSYHIDAVMMKEPTKSEYGEQIAKISRDEYITNPEKEYELFLEDRKIHMGIIEDFLKTGSTILLDRYYFSSLAYQGARGISIDRIMSDHKKFVIEPDLTFFFKVDVETAMRRIKERGNLIPHFENPEYLGKVASIFDDIKHDSIVKVNGTMDLQKSLDFVSAVCIGLSLSSVKEYGF